jgi:predicted metal-dependent phosphoesterase TrpH
MPTYRIDFHTHCQGDGIDRLEHTAFEHVDRAVSQGLHAVALTWHRKIFDQPEAIAYARERGLLLIPGMEAEIDGAHILVLNLQPGQIPPHITCEQLRTLRHSHPDILTIAPHPYFPHPTCLGQVIEDNPDCFDAVEWCYLHLDWIPQTWNPNYRASQWARDHHKPILATSDAHDLTHLGKTYTEVDAEELTIPALFAAIRAHRTHFTPHSFTLPELTEKAFFLIWGQKKFLTTRWQDLFHSRS